MEGDGVDGEGRGDKERMEGGRWIIISNKTAVKPCPDFNSRAVNSGHILNSYFGYYTVVPHAQMLLLIKKIFKAKYYQALLSLH